MMFLTCANWATVLTEVPAGVCSSMTGSKVCMVTVTIFTSYLRNDTDVVHLRGVEAGHGEEDVVGDGADALVVRRRGRGRRGVGHRLAQAREHLQHTVQYSTVQYSTVQ